MNNAIKCVVLATVSALAGCTVPAQNAAKEQESRSRAQAICAAAWNHPDVAPLLASVPAETAKPTLQQLADKGKPSAIQRLAIVKLHEYRRSCVAANQSYFDQYAPAARPIYDKYDQDMNVLWAALFNGDISFGQFNSARAKISTTAAADAIKENNNSLAQAEQLSNQRMQNYLMLQNNLDTWQNNLQNSQRRYTPITTDCYKFGSGIQCTQY